MTDEGNTTIVRRYIEEWANEGNEAALHDVIAPDWLSHGTQSATATPIGLPSGLAGAKKLHDEVRAIWPDNQWTIEDIFGSGDRVAVRMTNRATHRGRIAAFLLPGNGSCSARSGSSASRTARLPRCGDARTTSAGWCRSAGRSYRRILTASLGHHPPRPLFSYCSCIETRCK